MKNEGKDRKMSVLASFTRLGCFLKWAKLSLLKSRSKINFNKFLQCLCHSQAWNNLAKVLVNINSSLLKYTNLLFSLQNVLLYWYSQYWEFWRGVQISSLLFLLHHAITNISMLHLSFVTDLKGKYCRWQQLFPKIVPF